MESPLIRQRNGQRLRRFVFTLNNWTQEEYDWLTTRFAGTDLCQWIVIGKEVGQNGTQHLQGTYFTCEQ